MLRPVSARWFELLVPRESVARTLEALARTGEVELEACTEENEALIPVPPVSRPLNRLAELARRFQSYWPESRAVEMRRDHLLEREVDAALTRVEQWCDQAAPLIARIERTRRQQVELKQLRLLCRAATGGQALDLSAIRDTGTHLSKRVFRLPPQSETPELVRPMLYQRIEAPEATWLVVVGRDADIEQLTARLEGKQARILDLPRWLAGDSGSALHRVEHRLGATERLLERDLGAIELLSGRYKLATALGHLRRVAWLAEHLEGLSASDYMVRLRGWTCSAKGAAVEHALRRAKVPFVLGMPPPPAGRKPPSLCANPPWARPFELFGGLVGTPDSDEADPSLIVALFAPLLFGYMFGDIGHGATLVVLGLVLRKRFPATALMIWGGAWAMVFGLMFGAVFGREDLIPALWLHPVGDPLPVLFMPLIFGAGLLLLSMMLNGLEHIWSGRVVEWLLTQSGLALGVVLAGFAAFVPGAGLAIALVLALQYFGIVFENRHQGPVALIGALGELAESLLQLVVNTLSFIRVGAFALAHAGLSLAVISLADSTESVMIYGLVMVIGNALIIAIEGLVASIQTTRLVLFEFFNRFFTAGGRAFRPLRPPSDFPLLVPSKEVPT